MHAFSLDQASATEPIRGALSRQLLNGATANAPLIFSDCLKIPFSTNVSGTGLYLDAERQQIGAVGEAISGWGIYAAWFAPLSWEKGVTEIALIDTSSTVQMQMQMQTRRTLSMTGKLIGSRQLGATLYLVLRSYPQVPPPCGLPKKAPQIRQ